MYWQCIIYRDVFIIKNDLLLEFTIALSAFLNDLCYDKDNKIFLFHSP